MPKRALKKIRNTSSETTRAAAARLRGLLRLQATGQDQPRKPGQPGNGQDPKKAQGANQPGRGLFGVVSMVLLVVLLFMLFNTVGGRGTEITLEQFRRNLESKQI